MDPMLLTAEASPTSSMLPRSFLKHRAAHSCIKHLAPKPLIEPSPHGSLRAALPEAEEEAKEAKRASEMAEVKAR